MGSLGHVSRSIALSAAVSLCPALAWANTPADKAEARDSHTQEPTAAPELRLELEAGLRIGPQLGVVGAVGFWKKSGTSPLSWGVFGSYALQSIYSSVGVAPRLRLALNSRLAAEVSLGIHEVTDSSSPSVSAGLGLNLDDWATFRFTGQLYRTDFEHAIDPAFYFDATLTGTPGRWASGTVAIASVVLAAILISANDGRHD